MTHGSQQRRQTECSCGAGLSEGAEVIDIGAQNETGITEAHRSDTVQDCQ
jgi:hypothetical protein